jgi:hypothetical protein
MYYITVPQGVWFSKQYHEEGKKYEPAVLANRNKIRGHPQSDLLIAAFNEQRIALCKKWLNCKLNMEDNIDEPDAQLQSTTFVPYIN